MRSRSCCCSEASASLALVWLLRYLRLFETMLDTLLERPDAQVSAAIKNLDAPCFRYLLLDALNDGVEKLKKLPDFRHLDIDVLDERANKNASPGLGARESEQLLKYTNDENVMRELQQRLKRPLAVYAHAVRQYEDQWARSLFSC